MKTGFEKLDKIIDINKPNLILIADNIGGHFAAEFSGDIANNLVLKQEDTEHNIKVLELVSCPKEYLIKRLVINQCEVNYRNWCTYAYTDEEFMKIGKTINNLIETTRLLPNIEEIHHETIKEIKQKIIKFCNYEGIDDFGNGLIVLDLYMFTNNNKSKREIKKCAKWLRNLRKITKICNAPILVTYSKYCNKDLIIKDFDKEILKNIDTAIIINDRDKFSIYSEQKVTNVQLQYLSEYRKYNN